MPEPRFQQPVPEVLHVPVTPEVTRGYDYRQGDERRSGFNLALDRAKERAAERGRRQQLRPDPVGHLLPDCYLIQDIPVEPVRLVTD